MVDGELVKARYIGVEVRTACKLNGKKQKIIYLDDVEFLICDTEAECESVMEFLKYGYNTKGLNKCQKKLFLRLLGDMDNKYGIRLYGTTGYTGEIMDRDGCLKKGVMVRIPEGEMQLVRTVGKYEGCEGVS